MAQYSNEFRSRILRNVLPPENRSIAEVSKEEQVSVQTITKWIKQLEHGKVEPATGEISPASRSIFGSRPSSSAINSCGSRSPFSKRARTRT
jgi:transposase